MAQTNKNDQIVSFIQEHLSRLQQKFDQCTMALSSQASTACPPTLLLSSIESHLKDFVRLHHIDLLRKINYQINKLKDFIRNKELSDRLSSYRLTNEQVMQTGRSVACLLLQMFL